MLFANTCKEVIYHFDEDIVGVFMTLSNKELERYDRQIMIEGWGVQGQEKIKSSKVVVMGIGGLGCPVSFYLAAAGVGTIVLVDEGKYELSNLNRQILGWTNDVGRFKVESAAEKILAFNPNIKVETKIERVEENTVSGIISDADVVVDALDNWKTRFLINKKCVDRKIPLIHAGIRGMYGQVMTVIPYEGPCLRCLLPISPPEVERFPVLGATAGLMAMIQAMETIKILVGVGESLIGSMLVFDGTNSTFMEIDIKRSEKCSVCNSSFHA